ncbi:sensor domain-containing phosphodiesterase [Noviherbaspirillum galbum]|uniref:EAL domain-containing protein n=1 Tax=Noviherbaspirillum galbum TaxID=2709383 RepID=A0A6B3SRN9_9BURK|nr:EAL domain-containing protein [Noviherbaspirillum galbum]NEX61446.1 EAL domain-containing protein [Noviherbaspirillum galbum]
MALSDLLKQSLAGNGFASGASLPQLLSAIRQHLEMDVAFVAEFFEGRRVFRHVDPADPGNPIQAGAGDPLEETYCMRVAEGRLPQLMRDAKDYPAAAELPVTFSLPVGAHLSVPIRLSDGSLYGTFCCFSHHADQTLDQRDHNMMKVFADVAAQFIESEQKRDRGHRQIAQRIRTVLDEDGLSMVYQPIYDVPSDRVVGFEALSRFPSRSEGEAQRPPDLWFSDAREAGLGWELEERAIQRGLAALDALPADVFVSANISPEYILEGALDEVFSDRVLERVVLEITEHAAVEHYDRLATLMAPFRRRGLRIAVDDAGAGYASFRHILNLAPDRIKLDISLTRDIDRDGARRALAAAFSRFSEVTGTSIVAEGVETLSELRTLLDIGVSTVQGFYIGRPEGLPEAVARCR